MERLDRVLTPLKTFGSTRPVAFGAPVCALVGALAGLLLQTGPQDGPFQPDMQPAAPRVEATAEPIVYPSEHLPDYVVGTDFLKSTQPTTVAYVTDEPPPLPEPPEVPAYTSARQNPPNPSVALEGARWASERGDILDRSLPEDHLHQPDALMLADAAATGMTSR